MKTRYLLLAGALFLSGITAMQAQEKKSLTLDEAIGLAVTKSNEATLADTKVSTSKYEMESVKNNIYPEVKLSGQYQRLTDPNITLKIPTGDSNDGETASGSPKVDQLMLGMATVGMPLFSGFKLKNSIEASTDAYNAESFNAAHTKEQIAMQTIVLYVNLYKAQESISLIQENLKSANQRVTDFTAMEQNGIIARNDLLKAQLQASNIELSLEDAKKRASTINYQLVTLLKLQEGTQLEPNSSYFEEASELNTAITEQDAINQRNDLEALRWQQKASEANMKVAKADYYPTVTLLGGYAAIDIKNVFQVTNAINFGVGVSYDISNLFKNGKHVKTAASRAEATRQEVEILTDRIKVQVQDALENYNLAIKQNRVYTQAVAQADENYRIVKDKYDNGLSDTNDLLEADVQQLQAKLNETFSKADITQRYYELLNVSGKLTNSFNLTQTK
ncbi:TolC family protein [Flavobacterium alkalisoli]|uniref:TolC family protein n=2 Tax=Flavobacterium alkalisoli TaxID=2602769 RepID=A0A5B9FXV9_9FLAO|nr:TolC family protein [Flavobacterium alkalisoli]QEE51229.1 TolC family protein [Flavobacterium alkalisoli]